MAGQGKPMAAIFVACKLAGMEKERNVKERKKNVKRGCIYNGGNIIIM